MFLVLFCLFGFVSFFFVSFALLCVFCLGEFGLFLFVSVRFHFFVSFCFFHFVILFYFVLLCVSGGPTKTSVRYRPVPLFMLGPFVFTESVKLRGDIKRNM